MRLTNHTNLIKDYKRLEVDAKFSETLKKEVIEHALLETTAKYGVPIGE